MYKHEEVAARVGQMSPVLRRLVEELLRGGEFFARYGAPADEILDSSLAAQMRLVLSEPALRQEFKEFWQAYSEAAEEDYEAISRGEHDDKLQQLV
jgi:hypothetical protein